MTRGRTSRQANIQATGRPSWAPGRSQAAAGGGDAGATRAAGSSGAGGGASGPNPSRAAAANAAHATGPRRTTAIAISIGSVNGIADVAAWPATVALNAPFVAIRARIPSPPTAIGAPIANRISSSDQRTGWSTFAITATTVSATMIATNGRLPKPVPAGTLIAR